MSLCRASCDATSSSTQQDVGCVVLECAVNEDEHGEPEPVDILDAQFFDDELLVIIYRHAPAEQGEEDREYASNGSLVD